MYAAPFFSTPNAISVIATSASPHEARFKADGTNLRTDTNETPRFGNRPTRGGQMDVAGKRARAVILVCLVLLSEVASDSHLRHAMTGGHGFLGPVVAAAITGWLQETIIGATL